MKCVLLGYGEVGKGLYEIFKPYHQIDIYDLKIVQPGDVFFITEADILMVAIPYNQEFEKTVIDYQARYKPKATLIFSTVPIGTSAKLNANHCPVEGKHPNLADSMKQWIWWIGGQNDLVKRFFGEAKLNFHSVEQPETTELLKLLSTTVYGINIEFARYCNQICSLMNIDYELIKQYNQDVNRLCKKFNLNNYCRMILDAPKDKIGGHCIVPNAEILNKQFPHPYIKQILDENL